MKSIIFDFDGLMVDTESTIYSIWKNIFNEHNTDLEIKQWVYFVGTQRKMEPYDLLEQIKGESIDRVKTRALYESLRDSETAKLPLMPGVLAKIAEARALGFRVALASGSSRSWVHRHLDRLSMFDHFAHVCTRDDVKNAKPDPELYTLAARLLGCSPADCLAFEDSLNGLTAAKAAGARCVIVPNSVTSQSDFTTADMMISSLDQLSLAEILSQLSCNQ